MSDRELLEKAAKASGYDTKLGWNITGYLIPQAGSNWNPLRDSADALILAVKLRLCITPTDQGVNVDLGSIILASEQFSEGINDCYQVRRAIVRAAASIAESKEK